ncbi:MAG: cation:proton antiporter [Clostridia bacterium]|nr:cation:proton antiporter [Clostridia bacterium]
MFLSLAVLLLAGLLSGWVCRRVHLPALFGMILSGVLIGPSALNLLSGSLLSVSSDLRRIALIIILIRAGLKLDLKDLKKVGRPAVLMCFLPACCEVLGMVILAPLLLGLSRLESAILGAVIAAVSPAVVVPRMIRLIDEGYGSDDGIPQMILAGASVDDVFVIVLFTAFTGLALGEDVSLMHLLNVPVSLVTGILAGILCGLGLTWLFDRSGRTHMQEPVKVMCMCAVCFLLNWLENAQQAVPFAGLIAIIVCGAVMKQKNGQLAKELSGVFDRMWVPAEVFLFVLVGASVAVGSVKDAGASAVLLILLALVFRMAGVFLCTLGTRLSLKERLFCILAYTPKATVQAAIGGLPLAMGLSCGSTVLTVSVIAILLTAPLGAFAIDATYRKWLRKSVAPESIV